MKSRRKLYGEATTLPAQMKGPVEAAHPSSPQLSQARPERAPIRRCLLSVDRSAGHETAQRTLPKMSARRRPIAGTAIRTTGRVTNRKARIAAKARKICAGVSPTRMRNGKNARKRHRKCAHGGGKRKSLDVVIWREVDIRQKPARPPLPFIGSNVVPAPPVSNQLCNFPAPARVQGCVVPL